MTASGWTTPLLCPLLCLAALTACGCVCDDEPAAAPPPISCMLSSRADLKRVGRVVFVELEHEGSYSDVSRQMTDALAGAIQARQMFHVDVIARDDIRCRDLPLNKREPLTLEDLANMRDTLKCDAVLLGSLTSFHPHPRMEAGLTLKLLDLRDGKVIWGVDHAWDTTEHETQLRLKAFFDRQMGSGYEPAGWEIGTMSQRAFAKFVADETADTLSPTPRPTPPPAAGIRRYVEKLIPPE